LKANMRDRVRKKAEIVAKGLCIMASA